MGNTLPGKAVGPPCDHPAVAMTSRPAKKGFWLQLNCAVCNALLREWHNDREKTPLETKAWSDRFVTTPCSHPLRNTAGEAVVPCGELKTDPRSKNFEPNAYGSGRIVAMPDQSGRAQVRIATSVYESPDPDVPVYCTTCGKFLAFSPLSEPDRVIQALAPAPAATAGAAAGAAADVPANSAAATVAATGATTT